MRKMTANFCGTGKVYKVAAKDTNCAVAPCQGDTTSTKADVSKCCAAAVTCSTIAGDATNFCGTSKVYNFAKASTTCVASPCVKTDSTDAGNCCAAPVKCSTVASTSGFCGSGKIYDSAKANTNCAVAPCQGATTSTKADVSKCCASFPGGLSSDGSKVQWAHTTWNDDGMKYDLPTPIHIKAPAGKVIVLGSNAYGSSEDLKTGLNEIKDVHGYLLSLSDVGGLYYMSKGGSIWDHWRNHFLAWAA